MQRLHGGVAGQLVFGVRRIGREHRAPQPGRAVGRHLEAIAPGARVGEIAARAIAAIGLEIVRRGEHDEALRPGEAVERDAALLAHGAAAAVGADQLGAGVASRRRPGRARRRSPRRRVCVTSTTSWPNSTSTFGKLAAAARAASLAVLNCSHCTTNGCAVSFLRIAWSNSATSCAARPVPELEDRRDQADPRHVVGEPVLAQEIERRRMRGGGARIGLRAVIVVEHAGPARRAGRAARRTAARPGRRPRSALRVVTCHAANPHHFVISRH